MFDHRAYGEVRLQIARRPRVEIGLVSVLCARKVVPRR